MPLTKKDLKQIQKMIKDEGNDIRSEMREMRKGMLLFMFEHFPTKEEMRAEMASKEDLVEIKEELRIVKDVVIGIRKELSKMQEVELKLIEENTYDNILTCGPEPMMKNLLNTCQKYHIEYQASLERYMKCAIGICGQCTIGNGQRVCIEGPIFTKEQLITFSDFGQSKRDASGKKIPI